MDDQEQRGSPDLAGQLIAAGEAVAAITPVSYTGVFRRFGLPGGCS